MGSSYTNTKHRRRGGKPSKLQKLSKQVIYIAAIGLVCAATYTAIKSFRTPNATETVVKLPYGTIQQLLNLEVFMPAYLAANCKDSLLAGTQTIRVTGTIESGENAENFALIKKRPDQMLFTIDRDSYQLTFGVNGKTVWQRIRAPKHDDSLTMIEGDEAREWQSQARFFDRIIEAHLGNGSIISIEKAEREGQECVKVRSIDSDKKTVDTFVDPLTMHPISESQILPDGSIQQVEFYDYQDVDGMPIPFQMTTIVDDEIITRIQIDKAALNTGIMSRLFEIPESLLQANEQSPN
jgi:hypothetical protein